MIIWQGREVSALAHAWQLPQLLIFDEAGSTNDIARTLAATGAAAGSLVMAEHQSAGRGRMGRAWSAPKQSALLFSIVLRPAACEHAAPGGLPLRIGLAVARAVRAVTGARLHVKWPNDLVSPFGAKVVGEMLPAIAAEGLAAPVEGLSAWTDAAILNEAGIPAICFGPGDIGLAHAAEEYVPVREIEQATAVLTRVASEWLSGNGERIEAVEPSAV